MKRKKKREKNYIVIYKQLKSGDVAKKKSSMSIRHW